MQPERGSIELGFQIHLSMDETKKMLPGDLFLSLFVLGGGGGVFRERSSWNPPSGGQIIASGDRPSKGQIVIFQRAEYASV